jgi:putative SOS response-associated peptidase YedK
MSDWPPAWFLRRETPGEVDHLDPAVVAGSDHGPGLTGGQSRARCIADEAIDQFSYPATRSLEHIVNKVIEASGGMRRYGGFMCNDYRLKVDIEAIREVFPNIRVQIRFPEGIPNLEPRDDVRITDRAPILRAVADQPGEAELVQRRWSWPGPGGKPVYNFRSEGREFGSNRCLIIADGFYEFTTHSDPKSKRKHKWLFTLKGEPWFCIAGLWRSQPDVGEAFTMLTAEPSPDVAPYHNRQIVVLRRDDWARWLDPALPAKEILKPLPAGSLDVEQIC